MSEQTSIIIAPNSICTVVISVKRADIVKSYFINQLIWLFVGMIFAGIGLGLSWLLHGCPFDRSIDAFMVFFTGISISLFAGAIFFPLFYLGGEGPATA